MSKPKKLSAAEHKQLVATLEERFAAHPKRHAGVTWSAVAKRLEQGASKLWSLAEMERTGGEPDVVRVDKKTGACWFVDCAAESPKDRRSICYDGEARHKRKENKPVSSALEMATVMGIDVLTEAEYRELQQVGEFDLKTSSWIITPPAIRKLGGALFGDRRYATVFVYHNGAESYYAARGFRGSLTL